MGFQAGVLKFLISKNIQKGIKGGSTALVGIIVPILIKHLGIELNAEQQLALSVAIAGGLTSLLNFLKTKFPDTLGWL